MEFQGKVVVITGGSSGIGKAVAIELVKRGANVIINGRREQMLVEAASEIDPTGAHVAYVAGDISDTQIATTTVTVHIRRLREKMEPVPSEPRWIKMVRGIGYKFDAKWQP